jgi:8-oxo-dGTP pyrophosphatase MutT (NUDIX family)
VPAALVQVTVIGRGVVRAVMWCCSPSAAPVIEPDTWRELPGGGIEPGETYREAIIRELAGGTGSTITPGR